VLHLRDGIAGLIPYTGDRNLIAIGGRASMMSAWGLVARDKMKNAAEEQLERDMMRKLLLSAAGLMTMGMSAIGMSGSAFAGDFPAPTYSKTPVYIAPIYDWSGAYIGANGGWGSSRNCWDFTTPGGAFIATEGCHDANGGTAGGQLGYRWQSNAIVFGIEGQGNWADLKGSNVSSFFPGSVNKSAINAFGLFTGQIGYAWNNVLLYAKGGLALTDNSYSVSITPGNVLAGTSGDQTRWGGAIGAGLEYGISSNWTAGVEYDHLFMGNRSVSFTDVATGLPFGNDNVRQDVDLVTARVNYRWGGPAISKY
jgi:outer membrane immunogenic protein